MFRSNSFQKKHSEIKWISYTILPLETIVGAQSSILNNSQSGVENSSSGGIIATTFLRPLISCKPTGWPASIHLIVPGLSIGAARESFIIPSRWARLVACAFHRRLSRILVVLCPRRAVVTGKSTSLPIPARGCAFHSIIDSHSWIVRPRSARRFVSSVDNASAGGDSDSACGLQASSHQKFSRINASSFPVGFAISTDG